MTEFAKDQRVKPRAVREWWKSVCDPNGGDTAARAKLRRCRDTNDVMTIPSGVRLARMLGVIPRDGVGHGFDRVLDLARVLANITEDSDKHPMREVGWARFPGNRREQEAEERPILSEARFRRLLQADVGENLVSQFTRLIALMKGRANVQAIADAFRYWDHEDGRTRRTWAFEYYNAGAALPSRNDSPEELAE